MNLETCSSNPIHIYKFCTTLVSLDLNEEKKAVDAML